MRWQHLEDKGVVANLGNVEQFEDHADQVIWGTGAKHDVVVKMVTMFSGPRMVTASLMAIRSVCC